jgi:DNA-binding beta-propeller fold protein YncE
VAELAVALDPEGAALDAVTRRAYVTCARANSLAVVDLEELAVVGEIGVGEEPLDAVLDDATGRVFTANLRSNSVSVVDATRGRLRGRSRCRRIPPGLRAIPSAVASTAAARWARP